MDSGNLNINFVTKEQFLALRGVDEKSTSLPPNKILNDPNLVGGYEAANSLIKSGDNSDDPSYTTRAQACSAGFLRVRLGMKTHSHMMTHLWGVDYADNVSAIKKAQDEMPQKVDDFFNSIDDLIRIAKESNETIHIDTVIVGSKERIEGEAPKGVRNTPDDVKRISKAVREALEGAFESGIEKFRKRAEKEALRVESSSSEFSQQEGKIGESTAIGGMTHMHYDPESNILSINAETVLNSHDGSVPEEHLRDSIEPEQLSEHYGRIEWDPTHRTLKTLINEL